MQQVLLEHERATSGIHSQDSAVDRYHFYPTMGYILVARNAQIHRLGQALCGVLHEVGVTYVTVTVTVLRSMEVGTDETNEMV